MIEHPQSGINHGKDELNRRDDFYDRFVLAQFILNGLVQRVVHHIDKNG